MSLCVLRRWRSRGTLRLCLLGATIVLAIARLLYRWGILQPVQVGRLLMLSSYLAQTALHIWRSRCLPGQE
jgi:hypothetical protein